MNTKPKSKMFIGHIDLDEERVELTLWSGKRAVQILGFAELQRCGGWSFMTSRSPDNNEATLLTSFGLRMVADYLDTLEAAGSIN